MPTSISIQCCLFITAYIVCTASQFFLRKYVNKTGDMKCQIPVHINISLPNKQSFCEMLLLLTNVSQEGFGVETND